MDISDHEVKYIKSENGVEYLTFNILDEYSDKIGHCFSTRIGGVSKDEFCSLNLGIYKDDSIENIKENYNRIFEALELKDIKKAFSNQVHGNNVVEIFDEDIKDTFEATKKGGYDGMITNKPGILLITYYADCIPIYIYDKVNNAIGLLHSGWRSTLKKIARKGIEKMEERFGSNPKDLICVIGPSIDKCCFEVKEDLYTLFNKKYFSKKSEDKWNMDLRMLVKDTLINSGVKESNISDINICTKCNNNIFYSHRGDNGKTGSLAAFMYIRGDKK